MLPQTVPRVSVVQKWPQSKGSSKIDSIVWYDDSNPPQARYFGAEAVAEEVQEEANSEDWKLAKWYV
jgi:hypothetical protein